ncbi:MAG: DUF92 domain-containing protein [Bacteroidia bacterium]
MIAGALTIGVFVILSYLSGKIDLPGSLVGGVIAMGIFAGGGFYLLGLLLVFFVLGSLASHWKKSEKQKIGLEQEGGGKRSVRHAVSNGGVAGLCGFLAWLLPEYASVLVVMTASSLAAATSDTLSSELGNVYGKRFVDLVHLQRGTRGADGVISLEGSLAGLAGSGIITLLYGITHEWPADVAVVFLAGIAGNIIDSLLGGTLQRQGYLSNDLVNLGCTVAAAVVAGIMLIR